MRWFPRLALAACVVAMAGCSGGGKTPSAPAGEPRLPADLLDNPIFDNAAPGVVPLGEAAMGGATWQIDPASDTVRILPLRGTSATDDSYFLSLENFFSAKDVRITNISSTAEDLVITYTIKHPFPGPENLTAPPNGFSNRADLGITGRAVFLVDVPSATGNSYFGGSVVANLNLFRTVDGYMQPKGTIPRASGMTANAFPFKLIVDEDLGATGNRIGITNTGSPQGNYRPQDGWQGINIGANRDGWTGFDYLHGGQEATNSLTIRKSEISGTVNFDMVIWAKYTDPRGGTTAAQKRANRLPSTPASVQNFVYRLPYAALDVSKSTYRGETGGLISNDPISSTTVRFTVRDWDARAETSTFPDLAQEGNPMRVEQGGAGMPTVTVDVPGVTTSPVTLSLNDDDTEIGGDVAADSGESNDPLFFKGTVVNLGGVSATQSDGPVRSLARIVDVSNSQDRSAYEFPLAPDLSLITNPGDKPSLEIFQAFSVELGTFVNDPPLATVVLQGGPTPVVQPLGNVVFLVTSESDTEGDPVLYDIDVAYSGSFVPDVTGLDPAAVPPPDVLLYTGTAPGNPGATNLAVEARVRYYDAANALSPIELILPYEIAPEADNDPPVSVVELQGGPNPLVPSGGTIQFNLVSEADPESDTVQYEIMYDYQGSFTADFGPIPTPGTPPLTLHVSTPRINPGSGPLARTARVRYFDPLRAATPIVIDLAYTIDDPGCSVATELFDLNSGAQGWVTGDSYGLPNGDSLGWSNFTFTCTSVPAQTFSGGFLNGGYLMNSPDVGGCSFLYDYASTAAHNVVSPSRTVPVLCAPNEVSVTFDAVLYGNASANLRVYSTVNDGCNWQLHQTIPATGAPQALPNTNVVLTGVTTGANLRVRFEFTDPTGFSDFATGYAGVLIDNIRFNATSTGAWAPGPPPVPPLFSDNFESGVMGGWGLYGLPNTDAAAVWGAGCGDPGPWGGWNVCPVANGAATGFGMTVGSDFGNCINFPGDLAHSSNFNVVSPAIDFSSASGTMELVFDEITGCFQVPWTTTVYAAVNPPVGDLPSWGSPIGSFVHTVGEPVGTIKVTIPLPPALNGQTGVRFRFQVTNPVGAATTTICSDFTDLSATGASDIGFDNLIIRSQVVCP